MSWMWTLAFGYHADRTPMYGYAATRDAAMAAFAKSLGAGGMIEISAAREPRPRPKMANSIVSSNRLHQTYVSVDVEAAYLQLRLQLLG